MFCIIENLLCWEMHFIIVLCLLFSQWLLCFVPFTGHSAEVFFCFCGKIIQPYFGMFGYGGPIASMHLGRYAFGLNTVITFFFLFLPPYESILSFQWFIDTSIISLPCYRRTLVSSKTKISKKVYTLHLAKEALVSNSGSEHNWKVLNLLDRQFITFQGSTVLLFDSSN